MRRYTLRKRTSKPIHKRKRTSKSIPKRGGGFATGPSMVSPGNLVFAPYTGVGKDCPGNFSLTDRPGYITSYTPHGLPGFRGGGAYGFASNAAPLSPNGVGTSPMPFMPLRCNQFRGGRRSRRNRRSKGGALTGSEVSSAFPVVHVGAADSMRYYAPNAGYRNDFTTFSGQSAVPGFTVQTSYAAGAFNQACLKGGSRRRRKGGAALVGAPLQYGPITTKSDFDGRELPVKYGGTRRQRRSRRNH